MADKDQGKKNSGSGSGTNKPEPKALIYKGILTIPVKSVSRTGNVILRVYDQKNIPVLMASKRAENLEVKDDEVRVGANESFAGLKYDVRKVEKTLVKEKGEPDRLVNEVLAEGVIELAGKDAG